MQTTTRNVLLALSFLLPIAAYAIETTPENFKGDCVKAWMGSAPAENKVEYQNFGEKYCACAATKPLTNQTEINHAAQVCMAQTLLHDTMDTLEEDKGLDKLTSDDILKGCQDKWKLIYPKTISDPSSATNRYCQCAVPKLMEITKNNENMTDGQWYEKIDSISAGCAATIVPDKPAEDDKTEKSAPEKNQ